MQTLIFIITTFLSFQGVKIVFKVGLALLKYCHDDLVSNTHNVTLYFLWLKPNFHSLLVFSFAYQVKLPFEKLIHGLKNFSEDAMNPDTLLPLAYSIKVLFLPILFNLFSLAQTNVVYCDSPKIAVPTISARLQCYIALLYPLFNNTDADPKILVFLLGFQNILYLFKSHFLWLCIYIFILCQITKRLEELKLEYEKKNGKISRSGEISENEKPILPSIQSNWSRSMTRRRKLSKKSFWFLNVRLGCHYSSWMYEITETS